LGINLQKKIENFLIKEEENQNAIKIATSIPISIQETQEIDAKMAVLDTNNNENNREIVEAEVEDLISELKKHGIKPERTLSVIFEIMNKRKIDVDLSEFGNYSIIYIFEIFKKKKDNKIIEILKAKLSKCFKEHSINSSIFSLLEKLFLQDFRIKRTLLEKFNLEPECKTHAIANEEEIKEREIYFILFFFFKIKKFEEHASVKTAKLDFLGNYLTGDCMQRLFYPIIYVNNIRHLNFSMNKLGNLGLFYLGVVLRYNINILELDLSYNFVDDDGLFLFLVGIRHYMFFKRQQKQKKFNNDKYKTNISSFINNTQKDGCNNMEIDYYEKEQEFKTEEVDNSINIDFSVGNNCPENNKRNTDSEEEFIINELNEEEDFSKLELIPEFKLFAEYYKDPNKHNQKPKKDLFNLFKNNIKKNFNFANQLYDSENKQAMMLLKLDLSHNPFNSAELLIDVLKCFPLLKSLNLSRTGLESIQVEYVLEYIKNTTCDSRPTIIDLGNKGDNESSLGLSLRDKSEENIPASCSTPKMLQDENYFMFAENENKKDKNCIINNLSENKNVNINVNMNLNNNSSINKDYSHFTEMSSNNISINDSVSFQRIFNYNDSSYKNENENTNASISMLRNNLTKRINDNNEDNDQKAAASIFENNFHFKSKIENLHLTKLPLSQKSINLLCLIFASRLCKVKVLNISECKLSKLKLCEFFHVLANSKTLEEIYFKDCDLPLLEDEKALEEFLFFVRSCPNLKNLCVYSNKLKNADILCKTLSAINQRINSLKVLDYSKNEVVFNTDEKSEGKNTFINLLNDMRIQKPAKIEFIDLTQNLNFRDSKLSDEFKQNIAEIMPDIKIIY